MQMAMIQMVVIMGLSYLPHAEVEHGADVDDEEEGADHREGEDGGAGGAGVRLGDRAEDLLTGPGPVHCIHFEVCH